MLLGAYVSNGYDDIVGAQRCQILEGDRSPVDPVLSGHPRIADTLGTLDDIACESSVMKHVDTVGAVRRTEIADIPARSSENVTGVGVDPKKPIVTTCGSGITASLLALALARMGRPRATVYDGSWTEWGGQADTPVATGS